MSKANVVETVERDGHQIAIYESGAEYDMTDKRLVKPASGTVITVQNATVFNRKRQEKAAALLRDRIRQRHSAGDMTPVRSSAEAFAESGALLYEEVVLSPDAYPRDRIEAWEKLGKYACVLPADARSGQLSAEQPGTVQQIASGVADAMARVLADILRAKLSARADAQIHETIDGETLE